MQYLNDNIILIGPETYESVRQKLSREAKNRAWVNRIRAMMNPNSPQQYLKLVA